MVLVSLRARILFVGAVFVIALLVQQRYFQNQWVLHGDSKFEQVSFDTYDLYDFGVTSVDTDDHLDLFTVNHSARQTVAWGSSGVNKYLFDIKLGQDRTYPGVDASGNTMPYLDDGIYVTRVKKDLVIEIHGDPIEEYPAFVEIGLQWPFVIISEENAEVTLEGHTDVSEDRSLSGSGSTNNNNNTLEDGSLNTYQYLAKIRLSRGGRVVLAGDQEILELPHAFLVESEAVRKSLKIGTRMLQPLDSQFTLTWRDRHSMAWHDFNSDGINDVFIGRGGVKGQLSLVTDKQSVFDELLIRQVDKVEDVAESLGLVKGDCPGRQAAWVDVDGDDLLDLHVSCGRDNEESNFPDKIYIRTKNGFVEMAKILGLANPSVSVFRWLDAGLDLDSDLLLHDGNDIVLMHQDEGRFRKEVLVENVAQRISTISLSDINNDLLLDAFIPTREGSVLLINNGETFDVVKPEAHGLPSSLISMRFVDINRDGWIDAHAVPGGIYLGSNDGFVSYDGFTDRTKISLLSRAMCSWYDRDLDGHMNVVCGYEEFPPKEIRILNKLISIFRNKKTSDSNQKHWSLYSAELVPEEVGNWLQFDLDGGAGNTEGIGAYVTVNTRGHIQRQFVGQYEGSHYGQGHYRLYFGLGDYDKVDSVVVNWTGGLTHEVDIKGINRLIRVKKYGD